MTDMTTLLQLASELRIRFIFVLPRPSVKGTVLANQTAIQSVNSSALINVLTSCCALAFSLHGKTLLEKRD